VILLLVHCIHSVHSFVLEAGVLYNIVAQSVEYSALVVGGGYTGDVVVLRVACAGWWGRLFVEVA